MRRVPGRIGRAEALAMRKLRIRMEQVGLQLSSAMGGMKVTES
jgi:hypothetical protein